MNQGFCSSIVFCSVVACVALTGCDEGAGTSNSEAVSCDPACVDGEVCKSGKCVKEETPSDACNPACVDGEVCKSGKCEKEETPSDACDPACGKGEVCKSGKCEKEETPVGVCNPACVDGEVCKSGKCEKEELPTDACDPACDNGDECKDGVCVSAGGESVVVCEPGCGEDKICIAGVCVAKTCSPACDEANGEICVGGVCIEDESPIEPEPVVEPDVVRAEFLVTPTEGLVTYQSKVDAHFFVSLNQKPEKNVTIPVASANKAAGTLSVDKLEFTPENWNTPQIVTITGASKALDKEEVTYKVTVGPSSSEDKAFDAIEKIEIPVTHYSVVDESIENTLIADSTKLLLMGSPVVLTANFEHPENLKWKVEISRGIADDKATVDELVRLDKVNDSSRILRSVVDLKTKDAYREHKLDLARTVKVTVTGDGAEASVEIALKPYMPPTKTLTQLREIRDFMTPGHKKTPTPGTYELGELECGYYDKTTTATLNNDMIKDYVEPVMYVSGDSSYGTRASVVAAARFFVLQFTKDIPYASGSLRTTTSLKDSKKLNAPTIGNYTWKTWNPVKDKTQARIFGFNLTSKAYNTYSASPKESNAILGGDGQDQVLPWGCAPKNDDGTDAVVTGNKTNKIDDKGVVINPENGLCCSGFVSWVLHNGRFYLSNFSTQLFARNTEYDCRDDKGNQLRNFMCPDNLKGGLFNPNGETFNAAQKKLSQLKEEDFVQVSKLKDDSDIKAGDLLWYGNYDCEKSKNGGECPLDPHNCTGGSGHVAMVLGISRYSNKKINKVYVAESTHPSGNHLQAYTIKDLQNAWVNEVTENKAESEFCTVRDSRLIRMDNVYNYHHTTNPDKVPVDLNTYKYTELWF